MKHSVAVVVSACLLLLSLPAVAGDIYSNGPINGSSDAWTINYDFIISNTFTVTTPGVPVTQLTFGAWLFPGDVLQSVEVSFTSDPIDQGTVYFDQVVNFTQSGCFGNQYGFTVCTETGNFNGPALAIGTYWLNLQNAIASTGNPVYWDENDGIGCSSPGCPSQGLGNNCITDGYDCIGSESFTLSGDTEATVPEPSSAILFGSSFLGVFGIIRRKRF